jgi:hypothetical protein
LERFAISGFSSRWISRSDACLTNGVVALLRGIEKTQKSLSCLMSRAGGRDGFWRRAPVRRRVRRRTWATRTKRSSAKLSVSLNCARPSGPIPGCARSEAHMSSRRARSTSWARLMPGQAAAISRLTTEGTDSGGKSAGNARETTSKRCAIGGESHVDLCPRFLAFIPGATPRSGDA